MSEKFDAPNADAVAIVIVVALFLRLPGRVVLEGCEGVKFVVFRRTNRYWQARRGRIVRCSRSSRTQDREMLWGKVKELLGTSLREISCECGDGYFLEPMRPSQVGKEIHSLWSAARCQSLRFIVYSA